MSRNKRHRGKHKQQSVKKKKKEKNQYKERIHFVYKPQKKTPQQIALEMFNKTHIDHSTYTEFDGKNEIHTRV